MISAHSNLIIPSSSPTRKATIATAQPQLIYFFEARVRIPRTKWNEFDVKYPGGGGRKIVQLLERPGGLYLQHSAVFEGDATDLVFYNFWRIGPDANGLARAERALADTVLWAEFVKLMDRQEDKDLSYPLTYETQDGLPAGFNVNSSKYVRIEYDIEASGNSEFQARLEAHLRSHGRQLGWYLGNSYLQHTGLEGRLIQIWLVPGTLTAQQVKQAVEELPWRAQLRSGGRLFKDVKHLLLSRSAFDHDPRIRAADLMTPPELLETKEATT